MMNIGKTMCVDTDAIEPFVKKGYSVNIYQMADDVIRIQYAKKCPLDEDMFHSIDPATYGTRHSKFIVDKNFQVELHNMIEHDYNSAEERRLVNAVQRDLHGTTL